MGVIGADVFARPGTGTLRIRPAFALPGPEKDASASAASRAGVPVLSGADRWQRFLQHPGAGRANPDWKPSNANSVFCHRSPEVPVRTDARGEHWTWPNAPRAGWLHLLPVGVPKPPAGVLVRETSGRIGAAKCRASDAGARRLSRGRRESACAIEKNASSRARVRDCASVRRPGLARA